MYGLFGKFGSKEFAQKKGDVIYCEATQICYIEHAREVAHVILMLLVEQGWSLLNKTCLPHMAVSVWYVRPHKDTTLEAVSFQLSCTTTRSAATAVTAENLTPVQAPPRTRSPPALTATMTKTMLTVFVLTVVLTACAVLGDDDKSCEEKILQSGLSA